LYIQNKTKQLIGYLFVFLEAVIVQQLMLWPS